MESVLAIGYTLCGYPQLASEAKLVAPQIRYIASNLLLGEKLKPSFGFIDLNELIK